VIALVAEDRAGDRELEPTPPDAHAHLRAAVGMLEVSLRLLADLPEPQGHGQEVPGAAHRPALPLQPPLGGVHGRLGHHHVVGAPVLVPQEAQDGRDGREIDGILPPAARPEVALVELQPHREQVRDGLMEGCREQPVDFRLTHFLVTFSQ
jgi:hypothetical protein